MKIVSLSNLDSQHMQYKSMILIAITGDFENINTMNQTVIHLVVIGLLNGMFNLSDGSITLSQSQEAATII